jgi:hypothetical protein
LPPIIPGKAQSKNPAKYLHPDADLGTGSALRESTEISDREAVLPAGFGGLRSFLTNL